MIPAYAMTAQPQLPDELSCLLDFTENFTPFFEACAAMPVSVEGNEYYHNRLMSEGPHGLLALAIDVIGNILHHPRNLNLVPPISLFDIGRLEHNPYIREVLYVYQSNNPQQTMHYRPSLSRRDVDIQNLFEDTMVSVIEAWLMGDDMQAPALAAVSSSIPEDRELWRLVTSLVIDIVIAGAALLREHGIVDDRACLYRGVSYRFVQYSPYVYALTFSQYD